MRADRRARVRRTLIALRRYRLFATGRRRLVALAAVLAVLATAVGLGVRMLWPSATQTPRARQYLAFTACLLTDGKGLAGERAVPVWAGMQDASLATRGKVQFLPAAGATRTAEVSPYLASLVQRHGDLIVAVGGLQVAAVAAEAARYPGTRFVAVGSTASGDISSGANVSVVDDASPVGVRQQVGALVWAAIKG